MRLTTLHIVADGVHEMGLSHTDTAVEEQRVVGLRRALRDSLRCGHGELVAASDDERIELISPIQLGCRAPVKACLFGRWPGGGALSVEAALSGCALAVAWHGRKSAVLAYLGGARVLLGSGEGHRLHLEAEVVNRLLDQVGVAVANMLEVGGRNAHKKLLALDIGEPSGFYPLLTRRGL